MIFGYFHCVYQAFIQADKSLFTWLINSMYLGAVYSDILKGDNSLARNILQVDMVLPLSLIYMDIMEDH